MALDPKVEKKMVGAVMPWLTNFHHMRAVDKESAVREALKYAIQIYELHRETAAPNLLEVLQYLAEKCEESNDAMYGTLSTSFIMEMIAPVIAKATGAA